MLVIGDYESAELLYGSVASEVYRGRRRSDGQTVILKALKSLRPSPERIARFKREYEILCGLEGHGVVRAYDLATPPSRWVIVQEDFGGESLDHVIEREDLPPADLLALAIAIVDALEQVHEHHVIHKDVNPSNIVWNQRTKELKLIDLGIATVLSREDPEVCNPSMLEGTLPYISPEQTGRMRSTVDYRADFYSLGATLYELLTGQLPFAASDPMELVHSHIAKRPIPPDQLSDRVPKAVGNVIMRLLEKTPEQRYQSTYGIRRDLQRCLEELVTAGEIADFQVARHDVSAKFLIPQKLYGREREVESLVAAFSEVAAETRTATMMLVTGPAGIGKSALVQELYKPLTSKRGYFISGKFEQFQRRIPYSAVVHAFQWLVRELLTEPEEQLTRWKHALLEALGPNGKVIVDVIPEVELIVGEQPAVQSLGPNEARNRFNLTFRNFIHVFARPSHPLVLFLDDLQWADSASLKLIELLMTDDRPQSLLLIGAYRDNEVGPTDLLTLVLDSLRSEHASLREIALTPLTTEHIAQLIADTVDRSPQAAMPLANLVARNTEGNPLFVTEFLKTVYDEALIVYDRQQGRWHWNLGEIAAKGITENILELMIGKLKRLPETTQKSLNLAACVGSSFDLKTLSIVHEQSPEDTFACLLPAIHSGVIVTTSELGARDETSPVPSLRFFHDRVHQAAYALCDDEDQRAAVHLRIGNLLLANASAHDRSEKIFDLVDQLDRGKALITDDAERVRLAEMNLEAGRRAKESTAYAAAVEYLGAGLEVLPRNGWEEHYALTMDLHRDLAVAEFLNGSHERSDGWTKIALEHARTPLEKAHIYYIVAGQCLMSTRYEEAVATVRRGLALLDVDLPEDDLQAAVETEFAAIRENRGDTPVAALSDRPTMTDPRIVAATRLLQSGFAAAFYVDQFLYALLILRAVNLALQYGHPPASLDLYSAYGHLVGSLFGQRREGYEFGALAVELSERAGNPQDKCRSCFFFANWTLCWVKPLAEALPLNNAGFEAGLESGELVFSGYILVYKGMNALYCGKALPQVLAEVRDYLAWNRKMRNTIAGDVLEGVAIALANASGETEAKDDFVSDGMDDARYIAMCEANMTIMGLCYYHTLKLQFLFLYGELEEALAASLAAEALLNYIVGNVAVAEHAFHSSLLYCALYERADGALRDEHWNKLEAYRQQLASWAESCPQNFSHMYALVRAEMARVSEQISEAIEAYEQAIEAANEHGFQHDAALANELVARFWLHRKRDEMARGYMAEAFYRYRLWGARHKVTMMEAEYPWLTAQQEERGALTLTSDSTSERDSSALDLASVIKASQAISGEIVLEKLLERLMKLVIENAGAQKGILVLDADGTLRVQAVASVSASGDQQSVEIDVLQATPLSEYSNVAHRVVNYAARIQESVILNDALHEGSFTHEPYFVSHQPKSVLCMPLSSHGQLLGILYLENNLVTGAFSAERLEVLQLLSSQFAISFENASLYNQMEQKVEKRTEELKQKNIELEKALDHLRATQARLIHSERMASLGQLTAGVAHEINNPLNFVNNFSEVSALMIREIIEKAAEDSEARVEALGDDLSDLLENIETIRNHGIRAAGIVASMLQHTRGGAGEYEQTDVNAFVDKYVNMAEFAGKNRNPDVDVTVERTYDEAVGRIDMVPQEIGQVLVNLLNNAFDAVSERRHRDEAAPAAVISVSTRGKDGRAEIRVRDNGIGVPNAIRDRIFEPFFTSKSEGTGLGLSLCYDIVVNGHNGTLTVESTEGQGAAFVVTLPEKVPATSRTPAGHGA